jgi:hypothetical protein
MKLINHQLKPLYFSQKGEQSMKLIKYLLIITMVVICISFSYATKYSTAGGQGTSTVGTTLSDYTCLYDAAQDFNATANTGNWTLEIKTDLGEIFTANFVNTINPGNTVTIKPAAGVSPTITFLPGADNNVSGHIVIGCSISGVTTSDGTPTLKKMDGFTIDGSNNGGTSRDLTIVNTLGATGNLTYARNIYVVGDSDNVVIKNCNIHNYTTDNNYYHYGILFSTFSTFAPDGFTVQNCNISCTSTQNAGEAIGIASAGIPVGAPTGWLITGNTLHAVRDTIRLTVAGSGTISNNILRQDHGLYGIQGRVFYAESLNTNSATINIFGNNVDYMRGNPLSTTNPLSISYGVTAFAFGANGSDITFNVYNNMIGGLGFYANQSNNENYHAFYVLATTGNYNFFHNSINMVNQSLFTFTPDKAFAFGVSSASNGAPFVGTMTLKNNIVRFEQIGASMLYVSDAVSLSHVVSDYNDWSIASSGTFALPIMAYMSDGSQYATLSAWQAFSSQDAHSQNVDPFATSPSYWVSTTNLHFTGSNPAPLTPGTPITSPIAITTDFDGNPRSLTAPWKGCDEVISALVYSPSIIFTRPGETAIPLTVSGGIPPYNWVVNGGVGTLDMSTGTAVLFTPATTAATGDITVTDGAAQTAIIPVSVTPTSAPLFNDAMQTKEVRFEIFE